MTHIARKLTSCELTLSMLVVLPLVAKKMLITAAFKSVQESYCSDIAEYL